jgi:hypothetical protein
LEKVCDAVPNCDMETVIGDFKDMFAKESSTWRHSRHNEKNDNWKRVIKFAMGNDLAETGTRY